MMLFPAVIISMLMIAFNLIGDGLRDAFDPKMRRLKGGEVKMENILEVKDLSFLPYICR